MKEFDIDAMRPKEMHRKVLQLRKISGERFYREYNDQFIDTPCPACGKNGEFEFTKYGFSHKRCLSCHTLFTSPRPSQELLVQYYNKYKAPRFWTKVLLATDFARKTIQYEPRVKTIISLMKERNPNIPELAVDVGAGSGAFALVLKRQKYFRKVLALDFSKECIEQCRRIGLYSRLGSVETLENDSVDLLTMNDLIEHLSFPKNFLEQCFDVVSKGGFMSIACPNGEGFDFKILKEKTINVTPPEHLNYFNPSSMRGLLKQIGFNPVFIETPGILDVQMIGRKIDNGELDLSKNNEWLHYLFTECSQYIKDNFQNFLKENCLSSHMLVIAQK